MPNTTRLAIVPLLLVTVAVAACQSIPTVGSLGPLGRPLVSVTLRGGDCPEGACGGTTVIEHDGRVHRTAPAAAELGSVPGDVLAPLEAAVRTTDFDAVRARPFTGECPVNFDGQETIFEFGA